MKTNINATPFLLFILVFITAQFSTAAEVKESNNTILIAVEEDFSEEGLRELKQFTSEWATQSENIDKVEFLELNLVDFVGLKKDKRQFDIVIASPVKLARLFEEDHLSTYSNSSPSVISSLRATSWTSSICVNTIAAYDIGLSLDRSYSELLMSSDINHIFELESTWLEIGAGWFKLQPGDIEERIDQSTESPCSLVAMGILPMAHSTGYDGLYQRAGGAPLKLLFTRLKNLMHPVATKTGSLKQSVRSFIMEYSKSPQLWDLSNK